MVDSSFSDLCFVYFIFHFCTCQVSHCHFTLGFNVAAKVEMAIPVVY